MTGQIPDKVIFNGDIFDLVGVKGEGLYEPLDFGLVPISPHTANWRGFVSTYEVSEGILLLKELEVSIKDEDQSYPEINNVKPESRKESLVKLDYKNVNLKTIYTGTLLIAKDFIDSMYVHMGFQSPLSFEIVLELEFKEGKLINQENVSDLIKEYRENDLTDGKLGPQDDDYMKWIERTFSLDYEI
jgi:hypothetical protein